MVTQDCGLAMGGNIHTTLDDDEVDWDFGIHPDMQILSMTRRNGKEPPVSADIDLSGRIKNCVMTSSSDTATAICPCHGCDTVP